MSKIAIIMVIEGEYISAWQYFMWQRLLAMPILALKAIIIKPSQVPNLSSLEQLVLTSLKRLDNYLLFKDKTSLEPRHCLDLLKDDLMVYWQSQRCQTLLRSQQADIIIDLTNHSPPADLISAAKYGVWKHFFLQPCEHYDHLAGLGDYANHQLESLSGIVSYQTESCPQILFQASTSIHPLSITRTQESILWRMAGFMPNYIQRWTNSDKQVEAEQTLLFASNSWNAISLASTMAKHYSYKIWQKLSDHSIHPSPWVLIKGLQQHYPTQDLAEEHFQIIPLPEDRFWADPVVIQHEGKEYVFFEEYVYERGLGHISCMQLQEDGSYSKPITILEKPYHLSYPFIFEYQGQYYLIPESASNHSIELYRCESFPNQWVFIKNLMENVQAYDSTVYFKDGLWWLFASMRQHACESPNDSLYLFFADSPISDQWQAHPQNPVVSYASTARPAGPLFTQEGELYRPSQNCVGRYGRGLNINRIKQWDTKVYQEETVATYMPDGEHNLHGIHTLALTTNGWIADAVYMAPQQTRIGRWLAR